MARAPRNYTARRNELARALGYANYSEQRKRQATAPREVARKREQLAKRSGGSYRNKKGAALKPPRGGTSVTKTKRQTTTDTRSRSAFMKALRDAAKKDRTVALRVNFANVRGKTEGEGRRGGPSKPGADKARPETLFLFRGGYKARTLLAKIGEGDPWTALEKLAVTGAGAGITSAKGVRSVHMEAYDMAPAESDIPALDNEKNLLVARAIGVDARHPGRGYGFDWLDAGNLARTNYLDKEHWTQDDVRRVRAHLDRWS